MHPDEKTIEDIEANIKDVKFRIKQHLATAKYFEDRLDELEEKLEVLTRDEVKDE